VLFTPRMIAVYVLGGSEMEDQVARFEPQKGIVGVLNQARLI